MMIGKGSIVRSIAGRDSERFFVVFEVDETYALICDGDLRPLEKPKRKKLKHLRRTNAVVDLNGIATNNQLKQILSAYSKPDHAQGR